MTHAWDEFFADAQREIEAALRAAPTHAETIHHIWDREVSRLWPIYERYGRLEVMLMPLEEPILFEFKTYGKTKVIEAEGVIVHRFN